MNGTFKKFPQLTVHRGKIKTTFEAFAFKDSEPMGGFIHPINERHSLKNCILSSVGDQQILRSGLLDTKQRIDELFCLIRALDERSVRKAKRPSEARRLVILQLGQTEQEWEDVYFEHLEIAHAQHFARLGTNVLLHLHLPLHPLFIPTKTKVELPRVMKAIDKLSKLLNVEGWCVYCDWIHEQTEATLTHFLLEEVEEYPLEAMLVDIHRQVCSPLLKRNRRGIAKVLLQMREIENTGSRRELLVAMEKELVVLRAEIQQYLNTLCFRLSEAEKGIEAIEKHHKELIPLKWRIKVLKTLMENQVEKEGAEPLSWVEKSMLLQILNEEFHATTLITGKEGLGRTAFVHAVCLATSQLKQLFPLSSVLQLALNWQEAAQALNEAFVLKKTVGEQARDFLIVERFRELVLYNLNHLSVRLATMSSFGERYSRSPLLKENPELLNVLPARGPVPIGAGEFDTVPIVNYDPETAKPVSLTSGGELLLEVLVSCQG